jgi:hypothetical protein
MLITLYFMQLVQELPMMRVELSKVVEDVSDKTVQPLTTNDWRITFSQGLDVNLW